MASSFINQHGKPEYTHDYEWFEKGGPDGQLIRKGAVLCTEHIAQVKALPSFDHFYKVGHLCMVYCDHCSQEQNLESRSRKQTLRDYPPVECPQSERESWGL